MMPHEPVLDIMRRTIANLDFINHHASTAGPFEVTQLINSFLGALAHPWENLRSDLDAITIEKSRQDGWPIPMPERKTERSPKTLGDFIRLLRNGLAHGNISFLPGGQGQIVSLRIVNRDRQGRITWSVIITPEDMRQFLDRFVALVEELNEQGVRRSDRIA